MTSRGQEQPHARDTAGLLEREARFWDLQEERIESLYARPHDWRFVPDIAEIVIGPRIRTLTRILTTHADRIRSLLDVGCGNGWFCHAAAKHGIRSIGVDLSEKKIEVAKREADRLGVAELCHFVAGDVLQQTSLGKVDLLTSHGSLHHFPDFDGAIRTIVDRHLAADGRMLFVEPNFEGMAPAVRQFLLSCANHRFLARFFDREFYVEVTGRRSLDGSDEAPPDDANIRHESPAGKEFFGEHVDLDAYFSTHFEVIEREFYHYFAGHATNAFYVFTKPGPIRTLWRLLLPWIVRRDTRLLRRPEYQQYAEDGLWFLRRPAGEA
jgi:2-polyprenyl-3-methyl-5-hydroxy-6-metoxy-1,4-benzoquinol methylase